MAKGGWTTVWDDQQKVPYSFSGSQWIGYDDPMSVQLKSEYAKNKGLGGVMVWSIEQDDARGVCGQGKFPLMTALRTGLALGSSSGTTTTTTTTTTTKAPVTTTTTTKSPSPGTPFACSGLGYFRDPLDCNVYYMCQANGDG